MVATYDFRFAKLRALAFYTDRLNFDRYFSYALGVTVPIGPFRLIGVAARLDDRANQALPDDFSAPAHFNDADFFGLGGSYALSKRTRLYAVGARFVNRGNAAFTISDNSNAGLFTDANVPAGFNPWSAHMGIRHTF